MEVVHIMIVYKLVGPNDGAVREYEATEGKRIVCVLHESTTNVKFPVTIKGWPELGRFADKQSAVAEYRKNFGGF